MGRAKLSVLILAAGLLGVAPLLSCGGAGSSTSKLTGGALTLTLSDPATCAGPSGPFSHIYVSISDVQVSTDPNANPNDPSFVDLTPNLKNNPVQVDLLGVANNQCFLATLGANLALQPGSYQQIRVILAKDGTTISGNHCDLFANCVMLSSDPLNTPHGLLLSSEAQTGIKIPPGQIAGGKFVVNAGQTQDLNIDFDACASIVTQGNGQFRLKPVLRAGEVSTTSASINGTLVDSMTQLPITGGTALVALEQQDSNGVDRVVMQTRADASGTFSFCPVLPGTYDVVASAVDGSGNSFAATITLGVQPGNALSKVPMIAVSGTNTSPASLTGQVTTVNASSQPAAADITLSALQQITQGGSTGVTIPLLQQSAATANVATQAGAGCPANTACASFTLAVPAANPNVGVFSATGTSYSQGSGPVGYVAEALAFVPSSGGVANCTPSRQVSPLLAVTPGGSVSAGTLAFLSCQ